MIPKNTRAAMNNNAAIYNEYVKYGELADSRSRFQSTPVFRRKAKSVETRAAEAAERRTTRRSNICPTCHMTMPTGTGMCESCN